MRVGLYYSIIDRHHPDYANSGDPHQKGFDRYLTYMHNQVRELCTNYGKIDILWLDYACGELRGEAYRATQLVNMVRSPQPDILIDNRLETGGDAFGSLVTEHPSHFCGDFVSPEDIIPPFPQGITNYAGESVPWETCCTLNNHWGYVEFDREYKTAQTIIRKLVECVSKNGNLLLNIGPTAQGRFPEQAIKVLEDMSNWINLNGESLFGCGYAGLPKPDFGRYTRQGNTIYAHVMEESIGPVCLSGIPQDSIESVKLLSTGAILPLANSWSTQNYTPAYTFVQLGPDPVFTYPLPDGVDTVLEIRLKTPV